MSKFIGFVIGAIEIGVGIATGNVALIISGAAMILSQAVADLTAPKTPARTAAELTIQLGEQPRCAIFGEAQTAGSLVDAFNYGGQYGTDWEVQIVRLADHKCQGLTGFYVNDQYVAYAGDGNVAGYNGQLQVFFRGDTTNQALPAIVTTNGPGWTANDKGDSGCDVVVAYKADAPNAQNPAWPGGRPRFGWVVKGKLCYDPRHDSTVPGGSGAQRWTDPSTWTWSENAAVCRYNWVRGVFANDAVTDPTALLIGRGLSDAEAPPANIFAAANLCDEVVSGAPRYRIAGPIYANQQFIDVETMFAQATGGVTVTVQGSVELEPGQAKSVVASFTDDDLLAASKVTWNDEILSESATDWVNSVVANYVEPAQQWQAHDAPVVRDTADIIADGEPREATLTLRLVKWVAQAQRVAEIVRRMGRQWGRATVTLGPSFCQLEDGDWVNWTSNRHFGGATKTFRIDAYSIDPKWQNTLQLRLINSQAFAEGAFNPDQADAVGTTAPVLVAPAAGDFALSATFVSGSGEVLPALQLAGAATWSNVEAIWIEYRVYAVGLGVDANWVSVGVESPLLSTKTWPVAGSTQYQASLRYRVSGTWSPRQILGPVLTAAYGVGWGGNITGVPIYLTDGRVGYGLTAPGDLGRPVPNSIRVSSGIMGHAAGGTYVGDLAATANNPRGGWSATTAYAVNDMVNYSGTLYICISAVQAATAPPNDAAHWSKYTAANVQDGATVGAAWGTNLTGTPTELTDGRVAGGLASTGDLARPVPNSIRVSSGIMGHAAGGTYVGDLAATANNPRGGWSATTAYAVNDMVIYSGTLYICISAVQAATAPPNDAAHWSKYTAANVQDGATVGAAWGTNLAGRPANLAALAGGEAINNALVPVGVNLVVNSEMLVMGDGVRGSAAYPIGFISYGAGAGYSSATYTYARQQLADGSYAMATTTTGTSAPLAGNPYVDVLGYNNTDSSFMVPVKPGDTLVASALVAANGVSDAYVEVQYCDESFAYAGEQGGATVVPYSYGAAAYNTVSRGQMTKLTGVFVVPADGDMGAGMKARWARIHVRTFINAANMNALCAAPLLAVVPTGQTVVPPYTPGPSDRTATYGAAWGGSVTGRPAELTDGRVSAALSSAGDLQRPITNSLRVSSGIMGHFAGGTYTGDLNASYGAAWGSNLTGRPGNLAALAGGEAINNAVAQIGTNQLINSDFNRGLLGFFTTTSAGNPGGSGFVAINTLAATYAGMRNVLQAHMPVNNWGPTNGSGQMYWDFAYSRGAGWNGIGSIADMQNYCIRVKQGDNVFVRCLGAQHRCQLQLYVILYDKAGNWVETQGAYIGALDGGGTDGNPANFNLVSGQFTVANAGSAYAMVLFRMIANGGSDPYCFVTEPAIGILPPGQTVLPPYSAGPADSTLTVGGSGAMLGDGFTIPPIVAAGNRYIYSQLPTYSAPSTTSGNVGSSTISLPAGTLTIGGRTVSYGAMSVNVTGTGSTTVTYYLYGDDPTFSGSTTLVATTSPTTVTSGTGRIGFGQVTITYPAAGGTGTSGTGGGGGGGATCVWSDAWVETMRGLVQARDVVPGDVLRVLTEDGAGTTWEVCQANRAAFDLCYRVRGNDCRFAVTVSRTTPITLRDGSVIPVTDVDGHELPFCAGDDFWWEPCTIEAVGPRSIQKISVHNKTFAAGDAPGLSILTHNIKP